MAAVPQGHRRAPVTVDPAGFIRRVTGGTGDDAPDRRGGQALTSMRAVAMLAAAYVALLALFVRVDVRAAAEFTVIVNRATPVTGLSVRQLRDLIVGKRTRWGNGRHVTVVLREPGTPEREALLRFCCPPVAADPNRATGQAPVIGEAAAPQKIVNTAAAVKQFVFNVPGAIGVIDGHAVDDTVKVVPVIERTARRRGDGLESR
jgi:hypothetical protein